MLNNIEPGEHIYKISYPGIRINQLDELLDIEILPSPEEIDGLILHIGTNDASTTRVNKSIQEIMKDYANLLWKLEDIYDESHIVRSLCIPRLDEFAERAQELNSKIISFKSSETEEKAKILNWEPWFHGLRKEEWFHSDGLHLSNEGVGAFSRAINEVAERMLKNPKYQDRAPIDQKVKNEWIDARKKALGGQTIRHRRTNYPPIEESIPPVIKQLGQFDLSKYESKTIFQEKFDDKAQNEQGGYPDEWPEYTPVQKNHRENNWSANRVNSVPYSKKNNWSHKSKQKKIYPSVPVSSWTENQVRQNTQQMPVYIPISKTAAKDPNRLR